MRWFHRHKWQYLSKEVTTESTDKHYYGYLVGGSSEKTTREVTHIKRYCVGCGNIDVQTVPGKLVAQDLMKMGYYKEEVE